MNTGHPAFTVSGRRVVVVGAARSGIAAARLLARKGAHVVLSEMRNTIDDAAALRDVGIELETGGHHPDTLQAAELIVLSPGVNPWQPPFERARAAGIPVIGELELASRWLEGRIVAITGTKGKSTTTTLIGRLLEAGGFRTFVGGNLGTAASLQVDQTGPDVVHVLETSSFQLEMTEQFHPHVSVFLNFSADHLDRHRSVAEYARAKERIFSNQTEQDVAVMNVDDRAVVDMTRTIRARIVPFSSSQPPPDGVGVRHGVIARREADTERPLVKVSAVRLLGRHLLSDVIAASAVADLFGVAPATIEQTVAEFKGLEHALEYVDTVEGVRFINDSKATNVEAARQAIEAFDSDVVPIMGGLFKGGNIRSLLTSLAPRARGVVVIGESQQRFFEAFEEAIHVVAAGSMREAVRAAHDLASPGTTVVLAPACASFDMFRDYAERGRAFKEAVAGLAKEVRSREP